MSDLSPMERAALGVGRLVNESALTKRVQHEYQKWVSRSWMLPTVRGLTVTEGFARSVALRPERGVLLAVNHRTFFDCYLISNLLIHDAPWFRELFFPVRSEFFYTNPAGVAVNLMMGGGCMYPPIFRDVKRRQQNSVGMQKLVSFLERPGVVVGMHPEGKRNKSDDPYTPLPAKPGVGQLIVRARPTVLPVFVHGLQQDLVQQIKMGRAKDGRSRAPIVAVFGEPMDHLADAYADLDPAPRYKRIADDVNAAITRLGARERELRADLLRGLPVENT